MKTINKFILATVMAGGLISCETDIETPKLEGFYGLESKTLTASTNEVVMEGLDEEKEAIMFSWGSYQLTVDNPTIKCRTRVYNSTWNYLPPRILRPPHHNWWKNRQSPSLRAC